MVADGSLCFTSDRPGRLAKGRSDLYRAQRLPDGSFAEPVQVGTPINSEHGAGDTFASVARTHGERIVQRRLRLHVDGPGNRERTNSDAGPTKSWSVIDVFEPETRGPAGRDPHSGHGRYVPFSAADVRPMVRLVRRDAAGVERWLGGNADRLNRLAATCLTRGLSVAFLRAIEGSPWQPLLALDLLEALRQRQRRHERRQQAVLRTLPELAGRFRAAGLPFLLLKGPYLAARFYGHVLGREFGDLDVLIPRGDRVRACTLLEQAGYRRHPGTLLSATLTSFFVHGFDFSAEETTVDLHWGLTRHISVRIDEKRLWDRRRPFLVDAQRYDVLSDEHEVIFAAVSLLRDIERGRPKMKNVVDLVQLAAAVDADLDWRAMLAARDGTAGPLANVLTLCLEVAGAHDLSPRLSAALAVRGSVQAVETGAAMQFEPAWLGLGNKLWAARAYDTSLPAWLLWSMTSLPFRIAVHGERRGRSAGRGAPHG